MSTLVRIEVYVDGDVRPPILAKVCGLWRATLFPDGDIAGLGQAPQEAADNLQARMDVLFLACRGISRDLWKQLTASERKSWQWALRQDRALLIALARARAEAAPNPDA